MISTSTCFDEVWNFFQFKIVDKEKRVIVVYVQLYIFFVLDSFSRKVAIDEANNRGAGKPNQTKSGGSLSLLIPQRSLVLTLRTEYLFSSFTSNSGLLFLCQLVTVTLSVRPFFVGQNEWNVEERQKSLKVSVCNGIGNKTFQTVRKYVSFSLGMLRYSMVRFTVLFYFKRNSFQIMRCVELVKLMREPPNRFFRHGSRKIEN